VTEPNYVVRAELLSPVARVAKPKSARPGNPRGPNGARADVPPLPAPAAEGGGESGPEAWPNRRRRIEKRIATLEHFIAVRSRHPVPRPRLTVGEAEDELDRLYSAREWWLMRDVEREIHAG
jgi:hypothetical protein